MHAAARRGRHCNGTHSPGRGKPGACPAAQALAGFGSCDTVWHKLSLALAWRPRVECGNTVAVAKWAQGMA